MFKNSTLPKMYQNNSNSVGGNSYGSYSHQQPPTIGMEGHTSLQKIMQQQPLPPQDMIHQNEQNQVPQQQLGMPFLSSHQNISSHHNMMLFGGSGGLNGNGNGNNVPGLQPMNHPFNGYYYDYSNTAVMDQRFQPSPQQQHQFSQAIQNPQLIHCHPFPNYNGGGSTEMLGYQLNGSLALPPSLMRDQKQRKDTLHVPSKVTETKYVVTRNGPLGSKGQENAAASFFARVNRDQINSKHLNTVSQGENCNTVNGNVDSNNLEKQANTHLRTKNLQKLDSNQYTHSSDNESSDFSTNFCKMLKRFPPLIPSSLSKKLDVTRDGTSSSQVSSSSSSNHGKIRVILKVANSQFDSGFEDINENSSPSNSSFQLDKKRRQVTLYDPSNAHLAKSNRASIGDNETIPANPEVEDPIDLEKKIVGAPKMFAFDGVFNSEDSQEDIATSALTDIITAVLNGNDGCLFCYGHANLGKSRSMLGSDEYAQDMGLVPIAIAWLYRAIKERKLKSGSRFSVRVSALEISSQRENVRDLLTAYATENDQPPGAYLRQTAAAAIANAAGGGYLNSSSASSISSHLQHQSEIRAPSVDKAAYYLDAALSGRSADVRGRESHLIYTVHVYQYSVDPSSRGGVRGGRSRMHLIDFGGCERTKQPGGGGGITLSGLGNVILGIFNGQKVLPHRDSKVAQVLRECLGSMACHATMMAHVSPDPCHYSETLHTVQLASRLHRMRRKRMKGSSSGSRRKLRYQLQIIWNHRNLKVLNANQVLS